MTPACLDLKPHAALLYDLKVAATSDEISVQHLPPVCPGLSRRARETRTRPTVSVLKISPSAAPVVSDVAVIARAYFYFAR